MSVPPQRHRLNRRHRETSGILTSTLAMPFHPTVLRRTVPLLRVGDKQLGVSMMGRGGRPRHYFTVTSAGIEALRRAHRAWTNLWDGLDTLIMH